MKDLTINSVSESISFIVDVIEIEKFVMIMQIEEGDTKGGIIIPKDKFKKFVEFQRKWVEGESRR